MALGKLPRATAGNVLKRVLMKAAGPIKEEIERRAPDDPRTGFPDIKTSVQIKPAKMSRKATTYYRSADVGTYFVMERAPTGKPTGRWMASRMLEFGQGDMPLKPFVRPSFDNKAPASLQIIGTELKMEIEKAAKRLAKKRGLA